MLRRVKLERIHARLEHVDLVAFCYFEGNSAIFKLEDLRERVSCLAVKIWVEPAPVVDLVHEELFIHLEASGLR